MNSLLLRKALPHIIAIVVFLVVSFAYNKTALEGKVLNQSDVQQYKGMVKQSDDYREKYGRWPLWTESMFSGMPAFQIAMDTQSVSVPDIFYGLLTLWLKKPASFFFLACLCFYFLTGALRINPWIGIIGGLAYAYATYNAVIVAVGHDTKMQSIALLPGILYIVFGIVLFGIGPALAGPYAQLFDHFFGAIGPCLDLPKWLCVGRGSRQIDRDWTISGHAGDMITMQMIQSLAFSTSMRRRRSSTTPRNGCVLLNWPCTRTRPG